MSVFSINPLADANVARTVVAAANEIALDMKPGKQYRLSGNTALWARLVVPGEAVLVAAVATSGSTFLAAGASLLLSAVGTKTRVSILRDTADGSCSLSEILIQPSG